MRSQCDWVINATTEFSIHNSCWLQWSIAQRSKLLLAGSYVHTTHCTEYTISQLVYQVLLRTASTLSAFKTRLKDSFVFAVILCTLILVNLVWVAYAVRRICSDFMDMLRRFISCRIIIIMYYNILLAFGTVRLPAFVNNFSQAQRHQRKPYPITYRM